MIYAELFTSHFHFQAIGKTDDEAREAMRDLWEAHAETVDYCQPFEMYEEEVRLLDLTEARGWRDGFPLID